MISHPAQLRPIALANWLFFVAAMVIVMVAVGGITRLTESGLSITEWKPIAGAIPPLSDAAWQAEFDLYKATGEYKNVTGPAGMDLAAFKFIYFWEWFHRILGRIIGLAFLIPMVWFWFRGAIPAGYKGRLLALFALICGQVGIRPHALKNENVSFMLPIDKLNSSTLTHTCE